MVIGDRLNMYHLSLRIIFNNIVRVLGGNKIIIENKILERKYSYFYIH